MKTITKRFQKLERKFTPLVLAPAGQSVAEYIAAFLARKGIARRENESLMDTFALTLGDEHAGPSRVVAAPRRWLARRIAPNIY